MYKHVLGDGPALKKITDKRWEEEQKPGDVNSIPQGNPRLRTRAGISRAHVPRLLPARVHTGLHCLLLLHVSSTGAVQGMACWGLHVPASPCPHPWPETRHSVPGGTSLPALQGAAGAWVPMQVTASAALPELFSFPCSFTTEQTVIATSRAVGYHLQTETGWLHSFSEQNKTRNLK